MKMQGRQVMEFPSAPIFTYIKDGLEFALTKTS
jgi:hypothetical protein